MSNLNIVLLVLGIILVLVYTAGYYIAKRSFKDFTNKEIFRASFAMPFILVAYIATSLASIFARSTRLKAFFEVSYLPKVETLADEIKELSFQEIIDNLNSKGANIQVVNSLEELESLKQQLEDQNGLEILGQNFGTKDTKKTYH